MANAAAGASCRRLHQGAVVVPAPGSPPAPLPSPTMHSSLGSGIHSDLRTRAVGMGLEGASLRSGGVGGSGALPCSRFEFPSSLVPISPIPSALGIMALLRVLPQRKVEHEVDVVALVLAPDVAAVVAAGACRGREGERKDHTPQALFGAQTSPAPKKYLELAHRVPIML